MKGTMRYTNVQTDMVPDINGVSPSTKSLLILR